MTRRKRIIVGAASSVILLGGLIFTMCSNREPVYQDKRLTEWLFELGCE
jgi:hypothetical protein